MNPSYELASLVKFALLWSIRFTAFFLKKNLKLHKKSIKKKKDVVAGGIEQPALAKRDR